MRDDAARARQVERWADASHAVNGEFPDQIAGAAGGFWNEVDHGA